MIKETTYKDQKAISIGSDKAVFTFIPAHGGNMCSATLDGKEFMIQRPEEKYMTVEWGGDMTKAECSGMDDMFPTIDICHYEKFPWKGAELADHGEVWNLPADVEIKEDKVCLTFHGVRLPYVFHKDISMKDDNTVRIDYTVENPTAFDMDYLWACHTMLQAEPGLKLEVPECCKIAQAVFKENGTIGNYGDEFSYPVHVSPEDGKEYDLSVMGEPRCANEKYYFRDAVNEGYCAIEHTDGRRFEMRFPEKEVPYIGILQNYGCFRGMYNIFLEPCSAPFDRPDVANCLKKGSVIPANSSKKWFVEITVK